MQLLLPELEETVSVPDCNDRDSVESGLRPLLDRLGVSVRHRYRPGQFRAATAYVFEEDVAEIVP